MRHIAKKGQTEVAAKDAASALALHQASDLKDIVCDLADQKGIDVGDTKDITTSFLEATKPKKSERPTCTYFVYRGLVQSLLGRSVTEHQKLVGIMAGAKNSVIEICIAENVQEALACSELKSRWEKLQYDLLGLVVWDHEKDPQKYTEPMALLLSKQAEKALLLLLVHSSGHTHTWEFNASSDQEAFIQVDMCNTNKNRRKDTDFKIYPLDRVGVTFEDTAKSAIAKAVGAHLHAALHESHPKTSVPTPTLHTFKKFSVPADGFCFWHSVLAGLQFDQFSKVKRLLDGCAVNARQAANELKAAKQLRKTVAGSEDADELFQHGYVGLSQIHAIGEALNLAIRVTVEPEARSFFCCACVYIYIYS